MAKYATPVSKHNYMECWKHVWTKYGQAKRSYCIGKLVGILGELAYLMSMLFISFGGLYTLKVPVINELLDSVPHLVPLWEKFSALVFKPDMTPPVLIVLAILAAYVAPIVLSVAMAALVYLLYHPVPRKPDEDIVKNAETMAEKANRARALSLRAKNNLSVTCEVLYLVLVAALFTAVILLNIDKSNVIEQICSILPFDNMFVLTFVVFVLFVCYSVLNNVFVQITKWLFYCNVPHSLLADTQRFRLFAGEEAGELTEEEWNATHLEAASEMRIKAIEMEKNGEHARAKQLFLEAALSGDPIAMDHYARHCIISRHNQEAIYWLQCCIDTGKADDVTIKRLKDMKRGRHVTVKYY